MADFTFYILIHLVTSDGNSLTDPHSHSAAVHTSKIKFCLLQLNLRFSDLFKENRQKYAHVEFTVQINSLHSVHFRIFLYSDDI